MTPLNVAYLLPVISDARYRKRVESRERLGAVSTVLAFERYYYPGKAWSVPFYSLGALEHEHYYRRLIPFVKAMSTVRSIARNVNVLYAFGLDMLLLGWVATRALRNPPVLVYEVGDLGVIIRPGPFFEVLRLLENRLLRQRTILVVTSEAFIDGYFLRAHSNLENLTYQVIENKVDPDCTPVVPDSAIPSQPAVGFTIGYFGLIRCRRSWEALKQLALVSEGRIRIYVRGIPLGLDGFEADVQASSSIDYGGPYQSPDDLPDLYRRVDLVWIAHYMGRSSLRWNRANRFYESCFYGKPMCAQLGTQDGKVVDEHGLGIVVDLNNIDATVDALSGVGTDELNRWHQNVTRLPKQLYTYTDEHERLLALIHQELKN